MSDKKRKLKRPSQRRPKERLNYSEMVKEISKRTGFREDDISQVWREGIDIILETIEDKKCIILPKIGMFYPAIKTARPVIAMNGGVGKPERMMMPDRWILKFRSSDNASDRLAKITPTKEEIDALYVD